MEEVNRWEYVGECLTKFYSIQEDQIIFAKAIRNSYKSDSAKNEIASEFLSLVKEEVLISIGLFLLAFYNSYWNPHFIMMKQIDDIAGKSGYIVRHMAVQYYVMQKEHF